ncbi:MAG: hypothetical protein EPO40_25160 [Myxococcaceae bacterium]|nr:MAG: hypothetical protein EPO40_25160 [Myxococcaceae bacterium]
MKRIGCFLLLLLACSDEHNDGGSHGNLDPTCALIVERCHALDLGPGPIHDCHQLAEGNNVAMCASRRTECLALCPLASDAGASDAGAADAASDATGGGG